MIGNTNLYSDFECDKCNERFSGLENDFADFLGISRSIAGLSGEKQTRGFVGRKIGAKSRSFAGNNILIIAPEDVKREGTKTTISYIKNAFTPSNVYKALLKCSLSLLSDDEVKGNYWRAIDYLADRCVIKSRAVIRGYHLSFQTTLPLHIYTFRKKVKEDKIPTHVMCFYFQNHIIVFPLPFHEADIHTSDLDILLPPPYFVGQEDMVNSLPTPFLRDMTSSAKVDNEEDNIIFQIAHDSLKDLYYYDPATDKYEQTGYNPVTPKYLIITKEGVTVNPKELSAFIKAEMEEN